MDSQEPINPGRLGRMAAGTVLLVSVIVGGVLLWDHFRSTGPATTVATQATPETTRTHESPQQAPSQTRDSSADNSRRPDGAVPPPGTDGHGAPGAATRDERADRRPYAEAEPREAVPYAAAEPRPEKRGGAGPLPSIGSSPEHAGSTHGARPVTDSAPPLTTARQPATSNPNRPVTPVESAPESQTAGDEPADKAGDKAGTDTTDEDANPDSDHSPPVLDALHFEPGEIADGNTTTLSLQVHDDLSGVKDVMGHVRSPSGTATIYFQAQGDAGGNLFTARIAIPAKAETGTWYVGFLHIQDKAANPLITTYTATTAFPGGTLRVVSEDSDSTPPQVRGIFIEKRSVGGGETNAVRIDVTDDHSGVATVTGQFRSATQAALLPFACRAGSDPESWEGSVQIPQSAECGEWSLMYVRVVNSAGNIAVVPGESPPLAGATFQVASADCDSSAPTLESFQLIPSVVSTGPASEVLVSAMVRDEGTGATGMMGWVTGPPSTNGTQPKLFFTCAHAPNDPEGLWTGKITVPQNAATGTWKVGLVRLQDGARNSRDYNENDPALARGAFQVQ